MTAKEEPIAPVFGLLAVQFALLLVTARIVGGYGWDDGAITLAFSRTFAETGRFALTPASEQVEGFSSVSWFLINALVALFKPGFAGAIFGSQVLTLATLVASGAVLHQMSRAMGLSVLARYLVLTTFVLMGPAFSETVNGMEMGLLTLAGLMTVHGLYLQRNALMLWVAVPIFISTRFEAALYFAFLLAPLLVQKRVKEFARWATYALAIFATIALFRWYSFHALLPNTIYAKMNEPYRLKGRQALIYFSASTEIFTLFLPALAVIAVRAAVLGAGRRILGVIAKDYVLIVPILGAVLFALVTGKNWGYLGRMQFFALPFMLLLIGRAADTLAASSRLRQVGFVLLLVALTVWSSSQGFPFASLSLSRSHEFGITPITFRETAMAVERLRKALDLPRIAFLTSDTGGTGLCCSQIRVVDLALLTNATLARTGYGALGKVIEAERPEVIEVHGLWSSIGHIYDLKPFWDDYRAAVVDKTRFYIRNDIADQLVALRMAETVPIDRPEVMDAMLTHRYVGSCSQDDNQAFVSKGRVLWVR